MPRFKWVKPESEFASGSSGRVTRNIQDQNRKGASEKQTRERQANPPRSKDKLSNKRR